VPASLTKRGNKVAAGKPEEKEKTNGKGRAMKNLLGSSRLRLPKADRWGGPESTTAPFAERATSEARKKVQGRAIEGQTVEIRTRTCGPFGSEWQASRVGARRGGGKAYQGEIS